MGISVDIETVKSFVNETLGSKVVEEAYFICTDSVCHTVYFSESNRWVFHIKDLNRPIWYKEGAEIQYACYCNAVTIEQVKHAIREHGCESIRDLMKVTKVMIEGQCLINHPYGRCCSTQLNEILKEERNKNV